MKRERGRGRAALWRAGVGLAAAAGQRAPARTDAAQLAGILPLPAVVWALLWIALSLVILWAVLRPSRAKNV